MAEKKEPVIEAIVKTARYIALMGSIAVVFMVILIVCFFNAEWPATAYGAPSPTKQIVTTTSPAAHPPADKAIWKVPDTNALPAGEPGKMIRYGRELIAHTANYFGPRGSIAQISNGMNCQNCHLDAGTRLFANNFAGVMATYPRFSPRSGTVDPATKRISECFQRSLAGKVPDTSGKEVRAMLAYMNWIGRGVKKDNRLFGSSTEKIAFLDAAADPVQGKIVYLTKCLSCHGKNGEGQLAANKQGYAYPPLWGNHSYNDGAGMYRLSSVANFVKNNMPYGATYQNPQLTNEQAWNVAAFINSQPRPHMDQHKDWPQLSNKPIDYPFGPYADSFTAQQHKYGPFKPIKNAKKI